MGKVGFRGNLLFYLILDIEVVDWSEVVQSDTDVVLCMETVVETERICAFGVLLKMDMAEQLPRRVLPVNAGKRQKRIVVQIDFRIADFYERLELDRFEHFLQTLARI